MPASAPRFLQRLHFNPGAKPGRGDARPCIVQYHPQATSETARRQGYVIAFVEPWAEEHGKALAAGCEALDLLARLVENRHQPENDLAALTERMRLFAEADRLVRSVQPPEGAVLPNGTPRHCPTNAARGES